MTIEATAHLEIDIETAVVTMEAEYPGIEFGVPGLTGPVGPEGPPGVTWRGDWDWQASYVEDDVVNYGGAAWIATAPSQNLPAPDHPEAWDLFVDRGQPGQPGEPGPTGPTGPGGAGVPGNPTSLAYRFDDSTYIWQDPGSGCIRFDQSNNTITRMVISVTPLVGSTINGLLQQISRFGGFIHLWSARVGVWHTFEIAVSQPMYDPNPSYYQLDVKNIAPETFTNFNHNEDIYVTFELTGEYLWRKANVVIGRNAAGSTGPYDGSVAIGMDVVVPPVQNAQSVAIGKAAQATPAAPTYDAIFEASVAIGSDARATHKGSVVLGHGRSRLINSLTSPGHYWYDGIRRQKVTFNLGGTTDYRGVTYLGADGRMGMNTNPNAENHYYLPPRSMAYVTWTLAAYTDDGTIAKAWEGRSILIRDAGPNQRVLGNIKNVVAQEAGSETWETTIWNDSSGMLGFVVWGQDGVTIHWIGGFIIDELVRET